MTRTAKKSKAAQKIIAGLTEAIEIARGAQAPAKRATLKLVSPPPAPPAAVKPKRSRKKTVTIAKTARAVTAEPTVQTVFPIEQGPAPTFLQLFGKEREKRNTVGANVLVIREWMRLEGLPDIPERLTVTAFARVAARFLLPRHAWPHFESSYAGRQQAEVFLARWASDLLLSVSAGGEPKYRDWTPGIIPEKAALYSPEYLGWDCGVRS